MKKLVTMIACLSSNVRCDAMRAPMDRWSSSDSTGAKGDGSGAAGDSGDGGFSETGAEGAEPKQRRALCGFPRRVPLARHLGEGCMCPVYILSSLSGCPRD